MENDFEIDMPESLVTFDESERHILELKNYRDIMVKDDAHYNKIDKVMHTLVNMFLPAKDIKNNLIKYDIKYRTVYD